MVRFAVNGYGEEYEREIVAHTLPPPHGPLREPELGEREINPGGTGGPNRCEWKGIVY